MTIATTRLAIQKLSPASIPGIGGGSNAWPQRIQNLMLEILSLINDSEIDSVFVFRPTDPNPTTNVFADWASLLAAVNAVAGPKVVFLDDSLAPIVIPAGPSDLSNVLLMGNPQLGPTARTPVTVTDGAVFAAPPLVFDSMALTFAGSSAVISLVGGTSRLVFSNSSLSCSGTASFIEVTAADNSIELQRNSEWLNGGFPCMLIGADPVSIIASENSSVAGQTVEGAGGSTLIAIYRDASASITTQTAPSFTGTFTTVLEEMAEGEGYDDAAETPSIATATPPNVQNAIDQLKVAIKEGGVYQGTVQTTDATPTTLFVVPSLNDGVMLLEARVVGSVVPLGNRAVYVLRARVNYAAGTPTVLDVLVDYSSEDDPAWNCDIVVDAGSAVVQVTGVAATTIDWKTTVTPTTLEV